MIELKLKYLENSIYIDDNKVNVIEIHNKAIYSKIICAFRENILFKGDNDYVSLYNNTDKLDMGNKCLLITDIFFDVFNNSKIMNKMYIDIENEFNFLYTYSQKNLLQEKIIRAIAEILNDSDYHFKYKSDISIVNILKSMDVKLDNTYYNTPFENFSLIIDLNEIFKMDIIFIVNVKCYLTKDEINEIYKLCIYKKVKLIIIENLKDINNYKFEEKNII